jgi:hypothetical protein
VAGGWRVGEVGYCVVVWGGAPHNPLVARWVVVHTDPQGHAQKRDCVCALCVLCGCLPPPETQECRLPARHRHETRRPEPDERRTGTGTAQTGGAAEEARVTACRFAPGRAARDAMHRRTRCRCAPHGTAALRDRMYCACGCGLRAACHSGPWAWPRGAVSESVCGAALSAFRYSRGDVCVLACYDTHL